MNVAIVGATGYGGIQAVNLLKNMERMHGINLMRLFFLVKNTVQKII